MSEAKTYRIAVIGTGYVGTVTGACLSYLGHEVICVDSDGEKIGMLQRGQVPIYEPHLDELLRLAAERGGIAFTTDLADAVRRCDVIFIAVGTPGLPNGQPNLAFLEAAAHQIGASMDDTQSRVVVNKSTVPVGSGNLVETLIREGIASGGSEARSVRFGVASNPEFLREGTAVADSLYPDRIVLGAADSHTLDVLRQVYEPVIQQSFDPPAGVPRPEAMRSTPLVTASLTSAEMIKYAANAFLATKISFANEMANVCERVGADATEVMRGVGLDSRIGSKFLNAGIGWGGSCFGKDIQALFHTAREYDYESKLLAATLRVNAEQRQVVIHKLQERLRILKGRTIGLLGLAFKPDTDDLRDAPSLQIAERLHELGARVKVYDPIAMQACRQHYPQLKVRYCDSAQEVAVEADALVVVTEWAEFRKLDLVKIAGTMSNPVLIDGRNLFTPEEARAAGFDYSGIGRSTRIAVTTNVE